MRHIASRGLYLAMALMFFYVTAAVAGPRPNVTTTKQVYGENEPIKVRYSGLPGNKKDWITVAPASHPDKKYGQWRYTKGVKKGVMSFKALPAGDYEVRLYLDWPDGGYRVAARHPFSVFSSEPEADLAAFTEQEVYAPNEPVRVIFYGFPGNQKDWISITAREKPDNKYGQWSYTKGQKEGQFDFKGLPRGEYEVRAYLNWPSGGYKVVMRSSFLVR